jgi:hypothetical protein
VLPSILLIPTGGIVGGIIITKTGDFRIPLWIGCAATTASLVSLISLGPSSSVGLQTGLQIPIALGLGFVYISSNIAPQAALADHLHSVAVSQVAFMRVLGQAFGIAIGATIFQNQFDKYVNDYVHNGLLSTDFIVQGKDAESAFTLIGLFPLQATEVYRFIYCDSLQVIWYTGVALSAFTFLCSFLAQRGSLDRGLTTNQRLVQK